MAPAKGKGRVAAGLLLCLSAMAGAGQARMNGISEQVQVQASGGRVLVQLTVENRSDAPVYLPRSFASATELTGREFRIVDADSGKVVEYAGRMVKRGPLTADDFLPLAPHAVHRHSIDITRSYAFAPGMHRYRLSHEGSYRSGAAQLQAARQMPPASADFSVDFSSAPP